MITRTWAPLVLLAVLGALVAVWIALPQITHGGTDIVVTTDVDNELNDGLCSLREAIIASNTNADYLGCTHAGPGDDRIRFSIPSGLINITSELPTITDTVDINGGSHLDQGMRPAIELHGPGGAFSDFHGLTIDAPNTRVVGLIINSFPGNGILVLKPDAEILFNYIGTDAAGANASPNAGFGIQLRADNALIGGSNGATSEAPCNGSCNLIAGNTASGIIIDPNVGGTDIRGNFFGTDATGTIAIDTGQTFAIEVKGTATNIGGSFTFGSICIFDCNLIGGSDHGIHVFPAAAGTHIDGNFMGVNVSGTASLVIPLGIGVYDQGDHTIIGLNARNIISGYNTGIYIAAGPAFVHQNYIGTDTFGTAAIPNVIGIFLNGATQSIIDNGNIISGNASDGIYLQNSTQIRISGNRIGIGANDDPLANTGAGVSLELGAAHNIIGGPNNGNIIAHNGQAGIRIDGATAIANIISQNSIHDNSFGIFEANGGNAELPPPLIVSANANGASGTTCENCTVELFSDELSQGAIYEGVTTADPNGNWSFTGPLTGPNVTATALHNTLFNTSEFSDPFPIVIPTPTPSPSPSGTPTIEHIQGDINCDSTVTADDAMLLLAYLAGLIDGHQPAPCPDINEPFPIFQWGDVNCDGAMTPLDVLYIFIHLADATPIVGNIPCTPVGQPIDFATD